MQDVNLEAQTTFLGSQNMAHLNDFLAQWKDALAAVQSIITISAIISGGLFAYFKLFKGRTYKNRLEPSISAKLFSNTNYTCAAIKVCVKNVGLSRVDLDLNSSTINVRIYILEDYFNEFHNALWSDLGTVEAILHHEWIEPGELVVEERLLALPSKKLIAVGLRLRLLPKARMRLFGRERTAWNALAVATPETIGAPLPPVD